MENTTAIAAVADYQPSQYISAVFEDKAYRKIMLNGINAAESLTKVGSAVINVVGVMAKPGIRRARNAGDSDSACTDMVLVCDDGSAYFTKSEGIRKCLDSFMAAGLFDDGEPVPMHVEERQLPGGNTLKTIVLD